MSQLEYYRQDPFQHLPHRGGLAGWGVTLMVFGILAGLCGAIMLGLTALAFAGIMPRIPMQSSAALMMTLGLYVFVSVALIWLGIGSRSGRRWVRPLMIACCSLAAVSGLSSLVPMVVGIVTLSSSAPPTTAPSAIPANIKVISIASGGCVVLMLMVVLPLILLWFYGRRSVQATLDQMDPHPRWTDRCPIPVLTWTIACLLMGVGRLSISANAIFPFFTTVLTGVPAVGVTLCLGVIFIAGGILCFRLSKLGWLMTFAATLIVAGSYVTFALVGDHDLYLDLIFESIHIPSASKAMAEDFAAKSWIGAVVIYPVAVCYVLWIWKSFRTKTATEDIPTASV